MITQVSPTIAFKAPVKRVDLGLIKPLPKRWSEIYTVARGARRLALAEGNNQTCGQCQFASKKIYKGLKKIGIDSEIIAGTFSGFSHFYIHIGGSILDVTADQFNRTLREGQIVQKDHYYRMRAIVFGTYEQLQNFYTFTTVSTEWD